MGRETTCWVNWQSRSAEAKVLLETAEIIVRGGIKARIQRSRIVGFVVCNDSLLVETPDGTLKLNLGTVEALRWHTALSKPPPTLAQKLGIGPASKVLVLGKTDSGEIMSASTPNQSEATGIIAVLRTATDLKVAHQKAKALRLPLWCVYAKGKHKSLSDAVIRACLRDAGMIDTKSCSVSETLAATRYTWRKK